MTYVKTVWEDRKVEYPNRYKDQNGNVLTLIQEPGEVVSIGTPVDAEHMNKIEDELERLSGGVGLKTFTTTLLASNWALNETTNRYEYNVSNPNITSQHYVSVDPVSFEDKEKFSGNGTVNSYDGGFIITSTELPESNMNIQVTYQLSTPEEVN